MNKKFDFFSSNNKAYLIIMIIIMLIYSITGHSIIGYIGLALAIVVIIYNISYFNKRKHEWGRFIEGFATMIDSTTRSAILNLPFPLVITNQAGNIIWNNDYMYNILNKKDLFGQNIDTIIPDFKFDIGTNEGIAEYQNIAYNNRFYNAYVNYIKKESNQNENDNIAVIQFVDVTDNVKLVEEKNAVLFIEVDNLDEILRTVEESKRPLLLAEIESTISNYVSSLNGMIIKYSTPKYVALLAHKQLEQEMKKKFDILEKIKEIDYGNKLDVTLTIGIGKNGRDPLENSQFAEVAKELALGRGGDQVVIKDKEKLHFFGGTSKEVEKRTKVRVRVIAQALKEIINESSNVLIMGHNNTDIDCFGAAIGLSSAVNLLGKSCKIVLDNNIGPIKSILTKFKQDETYKDLFIEMSKQDEYINENTLLVVVDVHSKSYVVCKELLKKCKRIVIIDHHRRSQDIIDGTLLNYIEPYASSTSELVTELLQYMIEKPKIKRIEAEALLAGICVDTKNFTFKTGVRTFEAASFLKGMGADTVDVKRLFVEDLDSYIKRAEIIKSAKVEDKIAIAICPSSILDTVLIAQSADELLNINGIEASFVLANIDEKIYISGRSLGDINVQLILEDLGGGGHMSMAGAKVEGLDIDSVVEKLKQAIKKYLVKGDED